jgi:hypothetical protein
MQEKQQGYGEDGEMINRQRRRAAARQDTRRDNSCDQRQREILRQGLGAGHAGDLFARIGFERVRSPSQRAFRRTGNMPQ